MCIHSSKCIITFMSKPVRKMDKGNIEILERMKKKAQMHVVYISKRKESPISHSISCTCNHKIYISAINLLKYKHRNGFKLF